MYKVYNEHKFTYLCMYFFSLLFTLTKTCYICYIANTTGLTVLNFATKIKCAKRFPREMYCLEIARKKIQL